MARPLVVGVCLLAIPPAAWLGWQLVPAGPGIAAWMATVVCWGTAAVCVRIAWVGLAASDAG